MFITLKYLSYLAYVQRDSDNIVVLDWSHYAFDNYLTVSFRMKDIARYTARALEYLVDAGVDSTTLHIVGHSLGAHIAGFLDRYLNFTIPRVTGILLYYFVIATVQFFKTLKKHI